MGVWPDVLDSRDGRDKHNDPNVDGPPGSGKDEREVID